MSLFQANRKKWNQNYYNKRRKLDLEYATLSQLQDKTEVYSLFSCPAENDPIEDINWQNEESTELKNNISDSVTQSNVANINDSRIVTCVSSGTEDDTARDIETGAESKGNDSDNNEDNLGPFLATWALEGNIAHVHANKLLHILKKYHPQLPSDCRTLLSTVSGSTGEHVIKLENGEFWYKGLQKNIIGHIEKKKKPLVDGVIVIIDIGIDGLP